MGAFRFFERSLIVGGGDGAVTLETDGIAGSVVVGDVLEGESGGVAECWERLGGHEGLTYLRRNAFDAVLTVRGMGRKVARNRLQEYLGQGYLQPQGLPAESDAIRHPHMQILLATDVGTFRFREPVLLG